jgi:hypothetical protein
VLFLKLPSAQQRECCGLASSLAHSHMQLPCCCNLILIRRRSQLLYYTVFFTCSEVPAGQELTYDYGEQYHTTVSALDVSLRLVVSGACNS